MTGNLVKVLFGLVGCMTLLLSLTIRQQPSAVAADAFNSTNTLPSAADLIGFKDYRKTSGPANSKKVQANRATDGMRFSLEVAVASSEDAAKNMAKISTRTAIPMLKTSSTGRKIGQEIWRTDRRHSKPHSMRIVVRDGKVMVIVEVSMPAAKDGQGKFVRDKDGQPVQNLLTSADLKFAEDQILKTLNKLEKKGLTSKKPS